MYVFCDVNQDHNSVQQRLNEDLRNTWPQVDHASGAHSDQLDSIAPEMRVGEICQRFFGIGAGLDVTPNTWSVMVNSTT